ncbi:MAG: DNA polymerase III subunit delta' C-terminal domain-containing protein [Legionella sp.]|uniref:DNA polymerase III subunit delta' C-terminal domain-containing protein n=1 Tax=Legionella sp. TaxID=459 RepID=UPI0039E361F9
MNIYPEQWHYLHTAWSRRRNPQAMLFVGALDQALNDFILQFMQLIFCKNLNINACQQCADCQMVACVGHPDVQWIKPEKNGGPIKVDQIRELQHYSYLTPQRAAYRLIVIESAERMNSSAANALLKILEEPAPHTLFLLLANQISTVLPTVLSRCQILYFAPIMDLSTFNLTDLTAQYPPESGQAMVLNQSEAILNGLIAILENKEHPCVITAQWSQFDLSTLLWFFYLIYSQVQMILLQPGAMNTLVMPQLTRLASLMPPSKIFSQIDKINELQRKLSHNINVNHTLVLEDLLFDL